MIDDLEPDSVRMMECEAKTVVVFEEVEARNPGIWGVWLACSSPLGHLKMPPFFWIGPELAKRTV